MGTLNAIKHSLYNLPGFRTLRKLVIIQSDDWGALRTPRPELRDKLIKEGMDLESNPYHKYDSLESNEDITNLAHILSSVRDSVGNPAVITLNNSTANPNFKAIAESEYRQYFFEPFTDTYKRHAGSEKVKQLIEEGRRDRVFNLQFHGREHLNIPRWMNELIAGNSLVLRAFEFEMYSPPVSSSMNYPMEFMDALDYDSKHEAGDKVNMIHSGLNIFKRAWGVYPESFIAPCYRWDSKIEGYLSSKGVNVVQSQRAQLVPHPYPGYRVKPVFRYTGQRNKFGQIYTVRNVIFEPSLGDHKPEVIDEALQQIKLSFMLRKPAIISSHRVNYIGVIDKANRDKSNEMLAKLLKRVIQQFPDVEFLSSAQLGKIIMKS